MNYVYTYPRPSLTVDAMVFRNRNGVWEIMLIRRGREPFSGSWALPGGFVDMEETLEEAIQRELEEETGLQGVELDQFRAFSALDRDPRGRTVSVVFWGILADEQEVMAGDDAAEVGWFPLNDLPELAFDHQDIIQRAINEKESPLR